MNSYSLYLNPQASLYLCLLSRWEVIGRLWWASGIPLGVNPSHAANSTEITTLIEILIIHLLILSILYLHLCTWCPLHSCANIYMLSSEKTHHNFSNKMSLSLKLELKWRYTQVCDSSLLYIVIVTSTARPIPFESCLFLRTYISEMTRGLQHTLYLLEQFFLF